MDVLTSETCWAVNSEIIKQVTSSWSIFIQLSRRCTGPINIRFTNVTVVSLLSSPLHFERQVFTYIILYHDYKSSIIHTSFRSCTLNASKRFGLYILMRPNTGDITDFEVVSFVIRRNSRSESLWYTLSLVWDFLLCRSVLLVYRH